MVPLFLCFLLFFFFSSSISACDRCVHQSKSAFFSSDSRLSYGACGYGSLASGLNNGNTAGAVSFLFKDGAGCGACFQIRCKDASACRRAGTKVIVTDLNTDDRYHFVLSRKAFNEMALPEQDISNLGIVDVEYKRVPCEYENKNLAARVEEPSRKDFLLIKFLYEGGQTEIANVDVAQVGTSDWIPMKRNYGAVWDTSRVPDGALQFRFVVTSGFDRKGIWAKNVLPAGWQPGVIYDTGVQITEIAQEPCSPCDGGNW